MILLIVGNYRDAFCSLSLLKLPFIITTTGQQKGIFHNANVFLDAGPWLDKQVQDL